MATTAGALSLVSVTSSTANLLSAAATGGAAPYTYQWYKSTAAGFTPGGGNLITGATALALADSGLTAGTVYYYKVIATDSGAVTGTSTQLAVTSSALSQNISSFSQSPILGQLDLRFNSNTMEVQFDNAGTGQLVAGQAVYFSTVANGAPMVLPSAATSDVIAGFVNYNGRNTVWNPGDRLQMSLGGNVIYLLAAANINRGQEVTSLPSAVAGGTNGGVIAAVASGGLPKVGFAIDTAAVGQLVRVQLRTPAFILS